MRFGSLDHSKRRRIFISSLPKSGTHLVTKLLGSLKVLEDGYQFLDRNLSASKENLASEPGHGIKIGVDEPHFIKQELVESALRKVKGNKYVGGHVPYTTRMESILTKYGYRCISIIRDPRDVAVSHVHFVLKRERHFLHDYYNSLQSFDKCLTRSIVGYQDQEAKFMICSIADRVKSISEWGTRPICYMTRFEDLIGEQGGGMSDKQEQEIHMIAEHIGVPLSGQQVVSVMGNLFGGSHTFRKGQIGSWKEEFTEEHKKMFKDVAGKLLIELGYEKDMDW